jgi:hypothetical protein
LRAAAQNKIPKPNNAAGAGSGTVVGLGSALPTPALTTMLYKLALAKDGSMKMNGSADALADWALRLSPVEA